MLSLFIRVKPPFAPDTSELLLKKRLILNFTAISLFMVFSTVAGVHTPVTITEAPTMEVQVKNQALRKENIEKKMSTEEYVRNHFADTPILAEIARCESQFRQFDKNGEVLRGVVNDRDVGVMQINEYYHLETAEKTNIDIYTLEGNLEYGRKLYEKFGTDPWNASKPCWGKNLEQLAVEVKA